MAGKLILSKLVMLCRTFLCIELPSEGLFCLQLKPFDDCHASRHICLGLLRLRMSPASKSALLRLHYNNYYYYGHHHHHHYFKVGLSKKFEVGFDCHLIGRDCTILVGA